MDKEIKIPTENELKLINDYIKEKDFWKSDTGEEVMGLFLVLVGFGLEPDKAINNISGIVNAMSNEYGD